MKWPTTLPDAKAAWLYRGNGKMIASSSILNLSPQSMDRQGERQLSKGEHYVVSGRKPLKPRKESIANKLSDSKISRVEPKYGYLNNRQTLESFVKMRSTVVNDSSSYVKVTTRKHVAALHIKLTEMFIFGQSFQRCS